MIDILKQYGLPLAIAFIGGVSGFFQGTAAAKETAAAKIENVSGNIALERQRNDQQDEKIKDAKIIADLQATAISDMNLKLDRLLWINGVDPKEVTGDIQAKKPEVLKKAGLVKGVNPDGSPRQ